MNLAGMMITAIATALVTALFVRRFVLYVALISSNSMLPSLKPGYKIIVTYLYRSDRIKVGDILVFYSRELRKTMIKRVIGLPGECVEIFADGAVWINGEKLPEPYVHYAGGAAGSYRIPDQRYFLLGDNRASSQDSRHWRQPYISEKDIRGKAVLCLYPLRRLDSEGGKFPLLLPGGKIL
jgi:signal peptidase I